MGKYTIGLDFGTNSVRALVVDVADGRELGTSVFTFPSGESGVLLDPKDPNLARQSPQDYLDGTIKTVNEALKAAGAEKDFSAGDVIGIGIDTTGSTPIPVDAAGVPLALKPEFKDNLNAQAWLWKDHTSHAEAAQITQAAEKERPQYLAKCGGTYSSEWFWAKILHCKRVAPEVFNAAHTWVEHADWMPAVLTGTDHPDQVKRCICAAGHKAMFNAEWGGYPDAEFLGTVDADLAKLRQTLPDVAHNVSEAAGKLTEEWAAKLGLPAAIPVAMAAFDAHLGGVGSGIRPGTLVKIIGTSCCDLLVTPLENKLPDIPGICGQVPESILPGNWGLEAGQSAVGDIFNWYVNYIQPGGPEKGDHAALTREAAELKPGQSGLLALDWHNGNRTILIDQRLTGGLIGMTLHTRPAEIYRALIEATAFGARTIMERFIEFGCQVDRVINCGGISAKNAMLMQIYADVLGKPMEISASTQTCALGSAVCGAVVAGKSAGGYDSFDEATAAMTHIDEKVYKPIAENQKVYDRLYKLYKQMHDSLGTPKGPALGNVMKDLLAIRDETRE